MMKISTINHLLAACFMWLALLFLIFHISNIVFDAPAPLVQGYDITDGQAVGVDEKMTNNSFTLDHYLQHANIDNGRKVFSQCAQCHSAAHNGKNRIGPSLWGVVGRTFGTVSNFTYSKAMRGEHHKVWTDENLDQFLTSPRQFIPNTTMSFIGIKDNQQRADLIMYLRSLSDRPDDSTQNKF